jgi:hypothetical protein
MRTGWTLQTALRAIEYNGNTVIMGNTLFYEAGTLGLRLLGALDYLRRIHRVSWISTTKKTSTLCAKAGNAARQRSQNDNRQTESENRTSPRRG